MYKQRLQTHQTSDYLDFLNDRINNTQRESPHRNITINPIEGFMQVTFQPIMEK
jgi:hypothetical protein